MTTIIENINAGVTVNKIFNQFLNINTEEQHNALIETLKVTKFGTYKTIGIIEIIEKFEAGNCNEIVKRDFLKMVQKHN